MYIGSPLLLFLLPCHARTFPFNASEEESTAAMVHRGGRKKIVSFYDELRRGAFEEAAGRARNSSHIMYM